MEEHHEERGNDTIGVSLTRLDTTVADIASQPLYILVEILAKRPGFLYQQEEEGEDSNKNFKEEVVSHKEVPHSLFKIESKVEILRYDRTI
jgi:hypothetical protein